MKWVLVIQPTALTCAVIQKEAHEIVGSGTGISKESKAKKAYLIDQALALHKIRLITLGIDCRLLNSSYCWCYFTSYIKRVIIDGLIATAAASVAFDIQPKSIPFLLQATALKNPRMHLC